MDNYGETVMFLAHALAMAVAVSRENCPTNNLL